MDFNNSFWQINPVSLKLMTFFCAESFFFPPVVLFFCFNKFHDNDKKCLTRRHVLFYKYIISKKEETNTRITNWRPKSNNCENLASVFTLFRSSFRSRLVEINIQLKSKGSVSYDLFPLSFGWGKCSLLGAWGDPQSTEGAWAIFPRSCR